ncbi:MAG: hypothetical protein ACTFAL_02790 [Candidatus Electronema sp. V4]|uniref:hypothetical protein n=1 Tax=Candidatus Electronema sp. V4 TaxID=3454756 RepID=UPI0040557B62
MTKVISQYSDIWTLKKIQSLVGMESILLKKQIDAVQSKIYSFEERHGKFIEEGMHRQVDDMELVEWEGEIATLERLRKKLARLENVNFEYE